MADVRDKDLGTESLIDAADDYSRADGATNGTRKIRNANRGLPHYAPRPGLISAGTSAAGKTQDNTGLAFGTGNLTIGFWARLADWTPASTKYFLQKFAANRGFYIGLTSTGTVQFSYGNGATAVTVSFANAFASLVDGAWAFVALTLDRAGNATLYINGAAFATTASIAAGSAETFTSTDSLNWFSDGAGVHLAGTLGESWIVSGLLTATQVADIYRAGSIAPFCAYTANATTGQNTATIGGLSFFQWLDFGQGYGPIIRDRSGNNQPALLGTSGLTHAIPRNPPGVPARAPKTAIVGDGSTGSFARNTLNSQNPATGECALWWDGVVPTDATSTGRPLGVFTSSAIGGDVAVAKALLLSYSTAGIFLLLYNAAGDSSRALTSASLLTLLAGKRAVLVVRRNASGLSIFVGIDGDFFDATYFFIESTSGATPPAWASADVNGVYFGAFYRNSSNSSAYALYDLRTANVALTEAQLRTEYERGEPGPEWIGATRSQVATIADAFTGGIANGFSQLGTVTLAEESSDVHGGTKAQKLSGANNNAGLLSTATPLPTGNNRRIRVRGWAKALNTGDLRVRLAGTSGGVGVGYVQLTAASYGAYTLFDSILQSDTGFNGKIEVTLQAGGGDWLIDDFAAEVVGYTARLRTDTAAGLTALNGAKSAANDSTDFLLSTSGVTTSPDGRTQTIRFRTNTNGNQQIFGASCVDTNKKWRIRSASIVADGSTTVNLGSGAGGAQYVSAFACVSGLNDVSTFVTRVIGGAALWVNTNTTTNLDWLIVLDLAE